MSNCCAKPNPYRFETKGASNGSFVCRSCGSYTFVWNGATRSFTAAQWAAVLDKIAEPEEVIIISVERLAQITEAYQRERRRIDPPPAATAKVDRDD